MGKEFEKIMFLKKEKEKKNTQGDLILCKYRVSVLHADGERGRELHE